MAKPEKKATTKGAQVPGRRQRVELRNMGRDQSATLALDSKTFIRWANGSNGAGMPETLTIQPRERIVVDAAVLRCQGVQDQIEPRGCVRAGEPFLAAQGAAPAAFDPTL